MSITYDRIGLKHECLSLMTASPYNIVASEATTSPYSALASQESDTLTLPLFYLTVTSLIVLSSCCCPFTQYYVHSFILFFLFHRMEGCRDVIIHHGSISHMTGLVRMRTKESKGQKKNNLKLIHFYPHTPLHTNWAIVPVDVIQQSLCHSSYNIHECSSVMLLGHSFSFPAPSYNTWYDTVTNPPLVLWRRVQPLSVDLKIQVSLGHYKSSYFRWRLSFLSSFLAFWAGGSVYLSWWVASNPQFLKEGRGGGPLSALLLQAKAPERAK
jgi:hypothetical protein